jgi:hypothetical protein
MDNNLITVIITAITVMGGAGAWKFYAFVIRNRAIQNKEDLIEQNVYRDDLKARIGKLETDKDECNSTLLEMSSELSGLKVRMEFVEKENERLKYK